MVGLVYSAKPFTGGRCIPQASRRLGRCIAALIRSGRGPDSVEQLANALRKRLIGVPVSTATLEAAIRGAARFPQKYSRYVGELYGLQGKERVAYAMLRLASQIDDDADGEELYALAGFSPIELDFPRVEAAGDAEDSGMAVDGEDDAPGGEGGELPAAVSEAKL